VTVKYKIKHLKISAMIVDSKIKLSIIIENIIKYVETKINKSKTHDFSSIITVSVESIRIVHNLPVTLTPSYTIYEDFIIIKYHKLILIFSN